MSNEHTPAQPTSTTSEQTRPVGHIQIDRARFPITQRAMTGAQLRRLPTPPIGLERDLFQVVPGQTDLKIELDTVVELRDGQRFFTAPAHINPGRSAEQ